MLCPWPKTTISIDPHWDTASVPMVMVYNSLQWKPSKDGLHVLYTPAVSMLTFTTCMLRVRSGEHFITIYNGKGPQQSIHLRLARPPEDIAHRTTHHSSHTKHTSGKC